MEFLKKKIKPKITVFTYMYSNCQLYDYQKEGIGKYMFWTLWFMKYSEIDGYLRSAISLVFFILSNFTSTMYLFFCSNNEILLTLSFQKGAKFCIPSMTCSICYKHNSFIFISFFNQNLLFKYSNFIFFIGILS